jgi:hypothetical protein
MEMIFSAIISWIICGILGRYSAQIWSILTGFLQPDLPKISGNWEAEFCEQDENACTANMRETISLKQLGRLVWGHGRVSGREDEIFKYDGNIKRNIFIGKYRIKGPGGPSGSGAFQLKISGSDKIMNGYCIWLDKDSDNIDASIYNWKKR